MAERLGAVPERAAGDDRIGRNHLRILIAIAARANRFGGWGWALNGVIATKTKIDPRDVRRVVRELRDWGYLEQRAAIDPAAPQNVQEFRVLYDAGEGEEPGVPAPRVLNEGAGEPGVRAPRVLEGGRGAGTPSLEEDTRGAGTPGSGENPGYGHPVLNRHPGVPAPPQVDTSFSSTSSEKEEEEGRGEGSPHPALPQHASRSHKGTGRTPRTAEEFDLAVRTFVPEEFHPQLDAWLRSARYPLSVLGSIWPLLDPAQAPHFEGAIVGRAMREMQASSRPEFNATRLARWCGNLAQDAKASPAMAVAGAPSHALRRL